MPRSRRAGVQIGLVLSLGLSLYIPQPVLPADVNAPQAGISVSVAEAPAIKLDGVEIARLFDTDEHLWKRWTIFSGDHDQRGNRVEIATSADGQSWTVPQSCLSAEEGKWDASIESAAIVYNPAAVDGKRYLLWYVGSAGQHERLPEGRLGLATSADGQHFVRLPKEESPCSINGMILGPADAFPGNKQVVTASFGAPHCVCADGAYQLTFYRVGFDAQGNIAAAGIGWATSDDGGRWSVMEDEPMSVQVVGHGEQTQKLIDELTKLTAAYCASERAL